MSSGIDHHLNELLTHAPELGQSPGLTTGLASGLTTSAAPVDPAGVGQAASLALAGQGAQQAQQEAQDHHSSGWFDSVGSFFGHVGHDIKNDALNPLGRDVLKPVGQVLSYPLSEVQHTYRYVHDVWERHGALAALKELVLLPTGINVGQGVASDLVSKVTHKPGTGGMLGYQDSWNATVNGEAYRDEQGWHVSPGRDLARLIGYVAPNVDVTHNANGNVQQSWAKWASGAGDATFDIVADPTLKLGNAMKAAKLAKYTPKLAKTWEDIEGGQQLARRPLVASEGIKPNNVQVLYRSNAAVKDAFDRLGGMSTQEILTQHPMLLPMAKALGQAQNGQEVADAFEMGLTARNYSFAQYGVPHTSLTRRLLGGVGIDAPTLRGAGASIQSKFTREAIDSATGEPIMSSVTGMPVMVPKGPAGHIVNTFSTYAPFAFNSKTLDLSGRSGDPMDPEFVRGFYSVLRYSQNATTSKAILARYVEAPDLGEKVNIIKNAYRDALRASGLPDDAPYVQRVTSDLDFFTKQATGGIYAVDREGRPLQLADEEGNQLNRGVFTNQTGQIAFPDFNDWRKAVAESKGGLWSKAMHADDFLNRYVTTRFFKRLVLLSLGFASRVSAGELIPAALSSDARRVVGGGLMAAAAKAHPDFAGLVSEGHREGLLGARATTSSFHHIGTIADIDEGTGEAAVKFGEETHNVPLSQLTVFHQDITDEEMKAAADHLGVRITSDEAGHVRAAVGKALYGLGRGLVDKDYREVATLNVLANDGHLVAPGIASSHDLPRGYQGINAATRHVAASAGINLSKKQALGRSFRLWDSGDQNHPLFWKFALDEAASDPGVRSAARAYHETVTAGGNEAAATTAAIKADREWFESTDAHASRARAEMAHYTADPEKYSAVRVEALKGLVYGQGGDVNEDVLQALSRGETPHIGALAEKDIKSRPYAVKGRTLEPIPELSTLDRVISRGWQPIHGIINSLSRAPIWTNLVTDEYKAFKPWIDGGLMTKAEAHSISQVRALNRALPLIHNTMLRSKFSLVARNVFPFYFAQEQAYKRYGRALFSNPVAFRRMQLLSHSLHASGALQTDPSTGQQYFVFPGAGDVPFLMTLGLSHLGLGVLGGVPASVSGSTISLRSVYPEAVGPGVGPVVAVPLKAIADKFHPADPYVNGFLGTFGGAASANSSLTQELIPNATVRRVWEALDPSDKNRAFASTYAMNAAWAANKALPLWQQAEAADPRAMDMSVPREQLKPEAQKLLARADKFLALPNADPHSKQVAQDRIKNATHVQLMFKAMFGFLSPLAPSVEVGDVKLHADLQSLITKYGAIDGLHRFIDAHPDATPDTVFQSDNTATGTNPPATGASLDWINANRGWVNSHQLAAAYLMPQSTGKFSSEAYNEELAMHLRDRRTPQEFTDAIYTAIGNAEFIPSLKSYEAQKAQAEAQGNTDLSSQLSQAWQSYFTNLQQRNPVWYDNEFSNSKITTAQQAYSQLRQALSSNEAPDSPMVPVVRELVSDYQSYQQQLALASAGSGTYTKTQLNQSWTDYLDQFVSQHPEAQSLVYGVFRRLGSSG